MNTHTHYLLTTVVTNSVDDEITLHTIPYNHNQLELIGKMLLERAGDNFFTLKNCFFIQPVLQFSSVNAGDYQGLYPVLESDSRDTFKHPILITYYDKETDQYVKMWDKENAFYAQLKI
jgi:hypothetical protein